MVEKLHSANPASVGRGYRGLATLRKAARGLSRAIYPPMCPVCRAEAAAEGLCPDCWRETTFLAPPSCDICGATVHTGLSAGYVCEACVRAPPAWSRGAAAVAYHGVGRKLVLALKHGDRLDVSPLAATWMHRAGRELVETADLIAPTPIHWSRMLKRRFNQAAELARDLCEVADRRDAFAPGLLTRIRATETQDGKNREARHANVRDAIALSPAERSRLHGKKVLLIDDVLTTGATLSACAEVCSAGGAEDVTALVFARVAQNEAEH